MRVQALAGDDAPIEHLPPPELDALELLLEAEFPPMLEKLEASEALLPPLGDELPPPPDEILGIAIRIAELGNKARTRLAWFLPLIFGASKHR